MTDAPERTTLARKVGSETYETLNGNSMSMGYVDPVEYVRADLVPQWQPIETAPKDGTCILICDDGEVHEANWGRSWLESHDDWAAPFSDQDEQGGRYEFTPTHWMPKPTPPTVSSKEP